VGPSETAAELGPNREPTMTALNHPDHSPGAFVVDFAASIFPRFVVDHPSKLCLHCLEGEADVHRRCVPACAARKKSPNIPAITALHAEEQGNSGATGAGP